MNQSEDATSTKIRRLHKRTIVVVLLAVLPWILIALPGTYDGDDAAGRVLIKHRVHGWPFVHLKSTSKRVNPPHAADLSNEFVAQTLETAAAAHNKEDSALQLNLRVQRDESFQNRSFRESSRAVAGADEHHSGQIDWLPMGYWSASRNWPLGIKDTYFTPNYLGLFLNLICVTLFAALVAAVCESKIRRHGRLLRYSIASLLIGTTLISFGVAWIVQTCLESAQEKTAARKLQDLARVNKYSLSCTETVSEGRFPLIVCQLLNYGVYPWGKFSIPNRLQPGKIFVRIPQGTKLEFIKSVAKCAQQTQDSVELLVSGFDSDRQDMLHVMAAAKVTVLNLDFVGCDPFEIDLDFDKRHLTGLQLRLDKATSDKDQALWAKEQLEPFIGLESLQWASISSLSTEGAEFIWETKTQWPKPMVFSFLDEVSEELKEKLKTEFR